MAEKKEPAKVGRPTKFTPEILAQAEKLAKLGLTDVEMADVFGVTERTFNTWKSAHPEFLQSLKNGKALADANVAESLYHRALGYSHPAVKIMTLGGAIEQVPYTEHYPPDTAAAIFWLKNRQPKKWRDKHDAAEHDGDTAPESVTVEVVNARTRDS